MNDRVYNVLFLCTGNSARSILAEALLNHLGNSRFRAFSAGSHPTGRVNPFALEVLASNAVPVIDARSKSWDEFSQPDAPVLEFIFTVCGNAAGETCPHWPGHPMTAHWGIEDPAAVEGSDVEKRRAFSTALGLLQRRILAFVSLPLGELDAMAIQREIGQIGRLREKGD